MQSLDSAGRRRFGAAVAVALVCFAPQLAAAQAIRAAALAPIIKSGGTTTEIRDKFHEAVIRGLASLSGPSGPAGELGEVLSGPDTRGKLGEELLACGAQAACLPRELSALHVNRLVGTELTVAGKSYTISMRLYDGQGRELTHVEDLCEICTVREADEAVAKSAGRLAAAARQFPVEAVVAPVEKEKPKPAPPVVTPPPPAPVTSPMQPPPAVPPPPSVVVKEKHGFPWRPVAFASLGAGIIGLAVGIPLVVIDGHPTCDAPNPTTQCKEVYNTGGGGAALVALGTLGLVASVPLFYFDYRDRHRNNTPSALLLRGAPTAGGAAMTLEGRF